MRFALLALAACGSNVPNAMLGRPHAIETIGAPHEAIIVDSNHGAFRIWLDTGEREQITKSGAAKLTSTGIAIYRDNDHYVIEHAKGIKTVPGVVADSSWVDISPDETRFAVAEPNEQLRSEQKYVTVVTLANLDVRRYETAAKILRWTADGTGLWLYQYEKTFRLDIATGAIREMPDTEARPRGDDRSICESRGWRLTRIATKKHQEIWLEPFARRDHPETLASIEKRLLVRATNHTDYNTTHFRTAGPEPGELTVPMFTRSCTHFVFTLGDSVYVGATATGYFAHLIVGRDPMFAR